MGEIMIKSMPQNTKLMFAFSVQPFLDISASKEGFVDLNCVGQRGSNFTSNKQSAATVFISAPTVQYIC